MLARAHMPTTGHGSLPFYMSGSSQLTTGMPSQGWIKPKSLSVLPSQDCYQ